MSKKQTKTKTRSGAESLAEKLNAVPTTPAGLQTRDGSEAVHERPKASAETPDESKVHELYQQLRKEIPESVRTMFERYEFLGDLRPAKFETDVSPDSIEANIGYGSLYRQMHRNYCRQVAYYRSEDGGALSPEEARAHAYHACTNGEQALDALNELLRTSVDDLSFVELMELHEYSPRVAEGFWELVKGEGREEFESGHMASNAAFPLDHEKKLWNIAKYLGMRESFVDEWNPVGGIELSLIDVLAQTYYQFQYWLEQTILRARGKVRSESNAFMKWRSEQEAYFQDQGRWDKGDWYLPALSEKEAIDHAAEMADRFHKMYMRTLRQMRDHRRYSPVLINNAKQVNIAAEGGQQINVSSTD